MNDYRILVVDDEEDLCEILKFNLENEGYEVDTANSAEEALKMDISSYHGRTVQARRQPCQEGAVRALCRADAQRVSSLCG